MVKEFSPDISRIVHELAPRADLVHVTGIHMVPQIEPLLTERSVGVRFVLDLPDVESARDAKRLRFIPLRSWSRIGFGYYDVLRLWAYQRRVTRWFDQVLVCSEQERERLTVSNVVVVPNAVNVPIDMPSSDTDGRTLLFCGTLSYPPNVDGLQYFVRTILPEIRKDIPDVRLLIIGRSPKPEVQALEDGVTIRIVSNPPTVPEYYAKATVAIVPIRFGGGTRIKILEAWALGVPVVSTPLGCEGLDAIDGEHLAVAGTPVRFAKACVELLQTPSLRRRLTARGRELVWRKYRSEAIRSEIVTMVRKLVGGESVEALASHRRTGQ